MKESGDTYLEAIHTARLKYHDRAGCKSLGARFQCRRVIAGASGGRISALLELAPYKPPVNSSDPYWKGPTSAHERVRESGSVCAQYVRIVLHRSPTHVRGRNTRAESEHVESHRAFSRIDARICRCSKSLRAINVAREEWISKWIGCRSVCLQRERAVLSAERDRIECRRNRPQSECETQIES